MPTRVFVNLFAQSPVASAVKSAAAPNLIPFPAIVAGNKVTYLIMLVDGAGNFDPASGDNTYTVKLAIGDIVTGTVLAQVNSFVQENLTVDGVATSAWKMVLDTDVQPVEDYVTGLRSKTAYFEVQFTDPAGDIRSPIQAEIEILNKLIA